MRPRQRANDNRIQNKEYDQASSIALPTIVDELGSETISTPEKSENYHNSDELKKIVQDNQATNKANGLRSPPALAANVNASHPGSTVSIALANNDGKSIGIAKVPSSHKLEISFPSFDRTQNQKLPTGDTRSTSLLKVMPILKRVSSFKSETEFLGKERKDAEIFTKGNGDIADEKILQSDDGKKILKTAEDDNSSSHSGMQVSIATTAKVDNRLSAIKKTGYKSASTIKLIQYVSYTFTALTIALLVGTFVLRFTAKSVTETDMLHALSDTLIRFEDTVMFSWWLYVANNPFASLLTCSWVDTQSATTCPWAKNQTQTSIRSRLKSYSEALRNLNLDIVSNYEIMNSQTSDPAVACIAKPISLIQPISSDESLATTARSLWHALEMLIQVNTFLNSGDIGSILIHMYCLNTIAHVLIIC